MMRKLCVFIRRRRYQSFSFLKTDILLKAKAARFEGTARVCKRKSFFMNHQPLKVADLVPTILGEGVEFAFMKDEIHRVYFFIKGKGFVFYPSFVGIENPRQPIPLLNQPQRSLFKNPPWPLRFLITILLFGC